MLHVVKWPCILFVSLQLHITGTKFKFGKHSFWLASVNALKIEWVPAAEENICRCGMSNFLHQFVDNLLYTPEPIIRINAGNVRFCKPWIFWKCTFLCGTTYKISLGSVFEFSSDRAVLIVWLGLGTQSTLLGLGNHVLSYNSCFSYCRHGKKSVLDSNLVQ